MKVQSRQIVGISLVYRTIELVIGLMHPFVWAGLSKSTSDAGGVIDGGYDGHQCSDVFVRPPFVCTSEPDHSLRNVSIPVDIGGIRCCDRYFR